MKALRTSFYACRVFAVVFLIAGLGGCGKNKDVSAEDKAATGQVVATVNGQEVTVHELDAERQAQRVDASGTDDATTARLIQGIVERKLFMEKAIAGGADRQPSVLLAIRRAREDILAKAYLRQQLASFPSVSRHDIDQFILDNPMMFAERQILVLDEISVPLAAATDDMVSYTKSAQTLEEIADALRAHDVVGRRVVVTVSTGEIPAELLAQFTNSQTHDPLFLRSPTGALFAKLLVSRQVPITGDDALNAARDLLADRAINKQIAQIQHSLMSDAKVSYDGNYAAVMAKAPAQ